jgi:hypothetical protein
VDFLSTARTKRRLFAASALLVHHVHIPGHAARAAPDRLFGASAGVHGAHFVADGALGHVFFFSSFFSFLDN